MYNNNELPTGQWETCHITYETVREIKGFLSKETLIFVAIAQGPQGEYRVAKSKSFSLGAFNVYGPNKKDTMHTEAFDSVVAKLEQAGWERIIEKNQPWFNVQFRRIIAGS